MPFDFLKIRQAKIDDIENRTTFIIYKISYNQKTKLAFEKWILYRLKYINLAKDQKVVKEDFKRTNELIRRRLCRL
ncbi:MAG: hypothetical protein B6D35_09215 [Candidatus Brocadia sp. UTAMX2]|nr:MAG: hypothetical protein B6D35_09215 [Candidatus Brocadia sp. UTAMX2]